MGEFVFISETLDQTLAEAFPEDKQMNEIISNQNLRNSASNFNSNNNQNSKNLTKPEKDGDGEEKPSG